MFLIKFINFQLKYFRFNNQNSKMMCGGTGDVKEATEEIQQIVDSVNINYIFSFKREFFSNLKFKFKAQV